MSKTVKVSDQVYEELIRVQEKRETFSEEISRLLVIKFSAEVLADKLRSNIQGTKEYEERRIGREMPAV